MHSATTATGRSLPPPGTPLPENRPAPLTSPVTHHLAAPKPYVTSDLQCYIRLLIDNDRRSPLKINRQPRRLESAISSAKQTPAPQINRRQNATSRIAHHNISNLHSQHAASALTRQCPSNRHTPRSENVISCRKQSLAPCSNRHKSALFAYPTKSRSDNSRVTDYESWVATHQTLLTDHHSRLTCNSEFTRYWQRSMLWLGCVCCSCNTFRFDEGAASSHLRPLLLYGWRRSRSKQIA
jgi:hypothetical protein